MMITAAGERETTSILAAASYLYSSILFIYRKGHAEVTVRCCAALDFRKQKRNHNNHDYIKGFVCAPKGQLGVEEEEEEENSLFWIGDPRAAKECARVVLNVKLRFN